MICYTREVVLTFILVFILTACGGPAATSTPVALTTAPTVGTSATSAAEKTAEATHEATTEVTTEATRETTAEATREATTEATAEMTREVTTEATAEATREATKKATTEVTAEATREATHEATAEATAGALAPTFTIRLTGDIEATFNQDNGIYGLAPVQGAEATETPEATASPMAGTEMPLSIYTMRFADATGNYQVVLGFSSAPDEGTYTVGKEIVAPGSPAVTEATAEATTELTREATAEATAEGTSEPLFITVQIKLVDGTKTYDVVKSGTLTIEKVDTDNGVDSGRFTFEVGSATDTKASVTVKGEFANLALIRNA